MFLGYDFLGYKNSALLNTEIYHFGYNKIELQNVTLDELFVNNNITIPYTIDKPNGWVYSTIIDAKFQNNIEGGSITANNVEIEKIRFQKRRSDELIWQDIAEIEYTPNTNLLYEVMDIAIQNGCTYQYSLVPFTSTVIGNRVLSKEITADFEGVFLSDRDNNYKLLYNIETGAIQHHISTAILEPLNSQFPIIVDSNLDYRTGNIRALFLSTETLNSKNGQVSIRAEKLGRESLLKFLKNKKPKILRHQNGETMLIRIVGQPQEEYQNDINGIAYVSFDFVEIGNIDSETLKTNDMLIGLRSDFSG